MAWFLGRPTDGCTPRASRAGRNSGNLNWVNRSLRRPRLGDNKLSSAAKKARSLQSRAEVRPKREPIFDFARLASKSWPKKHAEYTEETPDFSVLRVFRGHPRSRIPFPNERRHHPIHGDAQEFDARRKLLHLQLPAVLVLD